MRTHVNIFALLTLTFMSACGSATDATDDAMSASPQSLSQSTIEEGTTTRYEERTLLDTQFKVYVRDGQVTHRPAPGFQAKVLPTRNTFVKAPGCYLACFSHNKLNSVYRVGNVFVMGQFRIEGRYHGRQCVPLGTENRRIEAELKFKEMCTQQFVTACGNNTCWVGGDTGGWFDLL